jgi:hypothetical protein
MQPEKYSFVNTKIELQKLSFRVGLGGGIGIGIRLICL